jgi:hypothetical protein
LVALGGINDILVEDDLAIAATSVGVHSFSFATGESVLFIEGYFLF